MFDVCNSIFQIWHILQHAHHQNSSLHSSPYRWSLSQFCPPPTSFPLVATTLFSASTCLFYSYSLIGFYILHISETIQYFFPTRCLLSALFFAPMYLGCLFSFSSVQFSSVAQSCLTLCDPMNCSLLSITNSPSITNSQNPTKLMPIESVMPSSHLILCHPLLLLPPIPPNIRVFSNESTLRMRGSKYWSFRLSISPSNEHPGLVSFRMDWLDLLAVQGTLKSLLQHHSPKEPILQHSAFFTVQLSHPYMTTGIRKIKKNFFVFDFRKFDYDMLYLHSVFFLFIVTGVYWVYLILVNNFHKTW